MNYSTGPEFMHSPSNRLPFGMFSKKPNWFCNSDPKTAEFKALEALKQLQLLDLQYDHECTHASIHHVNHTHTCEPGNKQSFTINLDILILSY